MIQIDDFDLPITVAQKIIKGTRSVRRNEVQKAFSAFANAAMHEPTDDGEFVEVDMFSNKEILEISEYLKVYSEMHQEDDYYST